jgi:hypothetical protein
MAQSAVEWLIEKHFGSIENCSPDFKNKINQAKEIEIELLEKVWKASEQNMRSQFSSSEYKNVTFKEFIEQFKI